MSGLASALLLKQKPSKIAAILSAKAQAASDLVVARNKLLSVVTNLSDVENEAYDNIDDLERQVAERRALIDEAQKHKIATQGMIKQLTDLIGN